MYPLVIQPVDLVLRVGFCFILYELNHTGLKIYTVKDGPKLFILILKFEPKNRLICYLKKPAVHLFVSGSLDVKSRA